MRCRDFEDHVLSWIDGESLPVAVADLRAHRDACASCRSLYTDLRGDCETPSDLTASDLTARVLALTSGQACDRARRLLGAGEARAELDRDLLAAHLQSCPGCAAVARVTAMLPDLLPRLSWLEPDREFFGDVIAATVGFDPEAERRGDRSIWQRLLRRPRLALEGAYAGTMAMMLFVGLPGPSVVEIPARVLQELRAEGVRVEQIVAPRLAELAETSREVWARAESISLGEVGERAIRSAWYEHASRLAHGARARFQAAIQYLSRQTTRFIEWIVSAWRGDATGMSETNEGERDE